MTGDRALRLEPVLRVRLFRSRSEALRKRVPADQLAVCRIELKENLAVVIEHPYGAVAGGDGVSVCVDVARGEGMPGGGVYLGELAKGRRPTYPYSAVPGSDS